MRVCVELESIPVGERFAFFEGSRLRWKRIGWKPNQFGELECECCEGTPWSTYYPPEEKMWIEVSDDEVVP